MITFTFISIIQIEFFFCFVFLCHTSISLRKPQSNQTDWHFYISHQWNLIYGNVGTGFTQIREIDVSYDYFTSKSIKRLVHYINQVSQHFWLGLHPVILPIYHSPFCFHISRKEIIREKYKFCKLPKKHRVTFAKWH